MKIRNIFLLFPGIILTLLIWIMSSAAQEREWELVWSDEFESGSLDRDNWTYQLGTGSQYGLNGWGNNELQYYTEREDNIFIQDNKLHIVAREENHEGMSYTSARIRSKDKADFRYGRYEIRARLPKGRGLWPAIWMMPTESVYGGWPQSGEIDILELVGHEPDVVHGTVHYGSPWPDNQHTGGRFELDEGTFNDDFHTFALEWIPDRIRWFVDDQLFFQVTPNNLSPQPWPFDQYFHFIMNVAVGGNWPGNPDGTTEFPQEMVVDYVRVYKEAEATYTDPPSDMPESLNLQQNHPNPYNPSTSIRYEIPKAGHVTLSIFDIAGRLVHTLVDRRMQPGAYSETFDAGHLPSGVYIYELQLDGLQHARQMTLTK